MRLDVLVLESLGTHNLLMERASSVIVSSGLAERIDKLADHKYHIPPRVHQG
jgi:hypothetical protein